MIPFLLALDGTSYIGTDWGEHFVRITTYSTRTQMIKKRRNQEKPTVKTNGGKVSVKESDHQRRAEKAAVGTTSMTRIGRSRCTNTMENHFQINASRNRGDELKSKMIHMIHP